MAAGHVRKRGSKWTYVHHVTDPATGESKHKWKGGFATKGEAQRALREAIAATEQGTFVEPTKMIYRDYIERIWLPLLVDQLESSTIESYERNMLVHVLPSIGGIRVQKLSPSHLNDLYKKLQGQDVAFPVGANRRHDPKIYERIAHLHKGGLGYERIAKSLQADFPDHKPLSKHAVGKIVARSRAAKAERRTLSIRTVRYIHTIISRSLKDAIKLEIVKANAATNASPPRKSKTKTTKQLWTAEQTQAFLGWAQQSDHRLWPAWAFNATSGDRRGANLGLRWQDIDFENGTASLIWTVTCVKHHIVVKPYGKTGNTHEILLDPGTLRLLRSWKARQNQELLASSSVHTCESIEPGCKEPGFHRRDLVFARPDSDYLHPDRFSREFRRAQQRYNRENPETALPPISLHALRHGWATVALEVGVSMKVVQDRLDHASERITADIYTHVRAPLQSDAAERVANLILPELDGHDEEDYA